MNTLTLKQHSPFELACRIATGLIYSGLTPPPPQNLRGRDDEGAGWQCGAGWSCR